MPGLDLGGPVPFPFDRDNYTVLAAFQLIHPLTYLEKLDCTVRSYTYATI